MYSKQCNAPKICSFWVYVCKEKVENVFSFKCDKFKHLRGHTGPPVSDVTFLMKGYSGPPVNDLKTQAME